LKMLDLGSRCHGALLKKWQIGRAYCTATMMPTILNGVRSLSIRNENGYF
jgi:hypothetical protein